MNAAFAIWFGLGCSFSLELMPQKTVWCAGVLLTCVALLIPQPSFSVPIVAPVLETQPIAQPVRLEIRLSEKRVNVYRGENKVKSYAIAVGRAGWETPIGNYTVKQKIRNPTWIHPLNGAVIPGGDPENPLGRFWIGFWTDGKNWIGFHGTPNPESVGTAASHGCIRMYNRDVEELFSKVSLGTEVIVRQ